MMGFEGQSRENELLWAERKRNSEHCLWGNRRQVTARFSYSVMGTGPNEVGGCFWVWDARLVKGALIACPGFGGTTWHPVREGSVLGIVGN